MEVGLPGANRTSGSTTEDCRLSPVVAKPRQPCSPRFKLLTRRRALPQAAPCPPATMQALTARALTAHLAPTRAPSMMYANNKTKQTWLYPSPPVIAQPQQPCSSQAARTLMDSAPGSVARRADRAQGQSGTSKCPTFAHRKPKTIEANPTCCLQPPDGQTDSRDAQSPPDQPFSAVSSFFIFYFLGSCSFKPY